MLQIRVPAIALAVATLLTPPIAVQANSNEIESAAQQTLSDHDTTVTLVTGDQVVLPRGEVDGAWVIPGEGRDHVRFRIQQVGDDLIVTPSDAEALLADNRIDPRLFNVTQLVDQGFDDASRSDIPLIAHPEERDTDGLLSILSDTLRGAGALVTDLLSVVGVTTASVAKGEAGDFWADVVSTDSGIGKLWLDGVRRPLLDESVDQVGAPAAWDAGIDGTGVNVALLDTGIDTKHPDIKGQIVANKNFTDESGDKMGHGTHVASILAGTGAASNGKYRGVAPGVGIINAKVCSIDACPESGILAAMEWATVKKKARIVNISLGDADEAGVDPLEEAVNRLTKKTGALFVIAAGNGAEHDQPVNSPATAEAALAVGAVNAEGDIAPFSSRGPRVGDKGLKPDITAPGVAITAAGARGSDLGEAAGKRYRTVSGTSMATPHVAGAAALLAQKHPDWRAPELKAALMQSADPNPDLTVNEQGAGELDIAAALEQTVLAQPASIGFGQQLWPHHDDQEQSQLVSYRNLTDDTQILRLSLTVIGPDGAEVDGDQVFELDDRRLIVPPGSAATTTLQADTASSAADGQYSGWITARDGYQTSVTTFGIEKEVESYDVTLQHTDRDGNAPAQYSTTVLDHDDPLNWQFLTAEESGSEVTLRLPKGRYAVSSRICLSQCDQTTVGREEAMIVQPLLSLDSDVTVPLDAAEATPVSVKPPDTGVELRWTEVGYNLAIDGAATTFADQFVGDSLEGLYVSHLGPRLAPSQMEGKVTGYWSDTEGDPNNAYALAWFVPGRAPAGFKIDSADARALPTATVTMDIAAERADETARGMWFAVSPDGPGFAGLPMPATALPASVTTHVSTGPEWFAQLNFDPVYRSLWSEPVKYQPGETYREEWNHAVFGPGRSEPIAQKWAVAPGATRDANIIDIADLALYSDANGHNGWSDAMAITGHTRLYADGELVGESNRPGAGEFSVPTRLADYRLDVAMSHDPSFVRHSRDVFVEWTFESEHTSEPTPLPLPVIRFSPDVGPHNKMPPSDTATIPLSVDGAESGIEDLSVEVSFDGGTTWSDVDVAKNPGGYEAVVHHPDGAKYVSLRAFLEDADGNTVKQTITRAYELTPD